MKKFQTFFVMFLYESEASRLQKKQWFLPWKQECYLKKRHFFAFPLVPNCMQNLKEGWKFFIPKMFDSYRIVPKVLDEWQQSKDAPVSYIKIFSAGKNAISSEI